MSKPRKKFIPCRESQLWERFVADNKSLFDGSTSGTYLANRLLRAFMAGIESGKQIAAEMITKIVTGDLTEGKE